MYYYKVESWEWEPGSKTEMGGGDYASKENAMRCALDIVDMIEKAYEVKLEREDTQYSTIWSWNNGKEVNTKYSMWLATHVLVVQVVKVPLLDTIDNE